jgi:hypothetical protein
VSQAVIHHPCSYGYSGQVGLPATVTAAVSATFSWQQLDPNTGYTVVWGDGTGNGSFTSSATGTGSAAHTYASNGTYTQTVNNTTTGAPSAKRTFTVPYSGGAGFAPRSVRPPDEEEPEEEETEVGAGFDPAAHTIPEVEEYVNENPDQADAILALEQAGKDRVTLVSWLENFTTGE